MLERMASATNRDTVYYTLAFREIVLWIGAAADYPAGSVCQ